MNPAEIPEKLRVECHCPSCGRKLDRGHCADPWVICLVCQNGHRFFILPKAPNAADSAKAASLRLPEISDMSPQAIASFWLSEPTARSVLNEQLAELLRSILEARSACDEPVFAFCPICGANLADFDQPDIWVRGLRCTTGHNWFERGGSLFCVTSGERLELQAEENDATISQLIAGWLKPRPNFESNLHDSVRRVLTSSPLCPEASRKP